MGKKTLMKSSLLVMILIIGGKVLALLRDSLIASQFGATYVTDIYNFAIGIVYLLTTISYGLTTTFIPLNTEYIESGNIKKRNRFVNNIISISSIVTVIITVLLVVFTKQIIYIFGHNFTSQTVIFNTSVYVTRIMFLSLIFVTLQSILAGALQSHKQFYEPAAMALMSNIVYIIYLVFLTAKYGIIGFAVATVIGFFVQFLINVPKYRKLGYKYFPVLNFKDSDTVKMFKLMIPVVISTSVVQLNVFVNRSFAINIYFGAATVLDYSNKINTLAYEVFAIGIAMIVYPTLSELAVKGDLDKYKKSLSSALTTIIIIMVPAAVSIGMLRTSLVTLIFRRGAFTVEAAKLTSNALLFYCPAMIAYGIRDILNKAFYSLKDVKTPMINSFLGIIVNIIINIFIVKYMKVSGLTLATTISAVTTTILMLWNLNKRIKGIDISKIFINFIKVIVASGIMGVVIFIINRLCNYTFASPMKASLVSILASLVIGTIVYAVSLYMVRIREYLNLVALIKSRIFNR
ncbi:murein biosynthesis integral membrane protein MurJ [Clostridium tyrobutyricum]|jgi:putative peptidoglycan lipid II flippase|uniref:murein biosynthesis integral membrane protein MurJ n=1 Tax=Clostridium tyrobutyricum TaxID=1519 RepID=UPI0003060803|nr:murein biosynthesis integral membrane protein MurJ [Clostridium tyrobutyricum]MBR9649126.1 murein biosynthesis integral membrane protein MurJ [Clostridium tyrobutyricum]MBV4415863.1 murein biosynthesis integral membrane protein MurJ [Clostridium tyrobutyricum]MBV4421872.1 murein biosynthesis integral membrane protein MurJ [Clostridium tyrobutyricum]MBV4425401.1 murein biosynthesis integral membrane protein MurJ [Clostridium tyrobutyricum]MBV4437427.1 murein biosynthesis integral membrane pr